MRHICRFALFPAYFSLIAGCGMEDTGTGAFNPATNVDLTFSTFTLADKDGVQNLKHTRFRDFYQGIEPNSDGNTQDEQEAALALATALRNHIDVIIGATREDGAKEYTAVRNPLDLMNQVIASEEVQNFRDGRRYISERIDEGVSGVYNNRSNGATITFTDQEATQNGAALANRVWVYPTLDWRYLPQGPEEPSGLPETPEDGEGLDDKVYRTIQYVARTALEGETATPPELVSLLAGTRFDALNFSISGYNSAELNLVDFTTRNYGSVEFRQDFVTGKYDELYLRNVDGNLSDENRITVDGEEADCLKVRLNYQASTLDVYASSGIPRTEPDPTEENPDRTKPTTDEGYCTNKDTADQSYSVAGVAERG